MAEIECLSCGEQTQIPERIETTKKYKGEFICTKCGARLHIAFTVSSDKDSSRPVEYKLVEKPPPPPATINYIANSPEIIGKMKRIGDRTKPENK